MKKLSTLLSHRAALLSDAHLANQAYAYVTLLGFQHRLCRAQITGPVTLRFSSPQAERYWPQLLALESSQSVIEEHFTDKDILELADVIEFLSGDGTHDLTFDVVELGDDFLLPLRTELERQGVVIDHPSSPIEEPRRQN